VYPLITYIELVVPVKGFLDLDPKILWKFCARVLYKAVYLSIISYGSKRFRALTELNIPAVLAVLVLDAFEEENGGKRERGRTSSRGALQRCGNTLYFPIVDVRVNRHFDALHL
jgi:hypothetical protein